MGKMSYLEKRQALVHETLDEFANIAEFSLETRLQVVRSEVRNPIISLRRQWWEINQERRQRKAIRLSSGIQCNGTPTFEAYRPISPSPLLFFDTRVSEDMLITNRELEERATVVKQGGPLRLMFSGRLIAMKGADDLALVAAELRRLGVSFEMTICGGGVLEPQIRTDIERRGLADHVKLAGILDFKTDSSRSPSRGRPLRLLSPYGRPVVHLPGRDGVRSPDRRLRQRGIPGDRARVRCRLASADEPGKAGRREDRRAKQGSHHAA